MLGIRNLEINEEELDVVYLQQIVQGDSRYKNIFSSIWEISEELEKRGKNLQDLIGWITRMHQNQIGQMYAEWQRASGKPITIRQERIIFRNYRIQISLALISKMVAFLEHINKASEITKLFGLHNLSPIIISKKTRGYSKGGKGKAEQNKARIRKRHERLQRLHQEMRQRNEGMSDHVIDLRIAKQERLKRSTVYNTPKRGSMN